MKKKSLTIGNAKKKARAKSATRSKEAPAKKITKPYGFLIKKDGTLETKEEREKRLARLEALTLRAFQMAYDNYHRQ